MKKALLLIAVLTISCNVFAEDKPVDFQKFKVIYKVQYNAITLERATELEKLIKQFCKDACSVKIVIDKEEQITTYIDGSSVMEWQADPQFIITPDMLIDIPCGGGE